MADDPKEKLKKKIEDLKDQLAKNKAAGKDLKKDPTCRQLRKTLKRTQRRLAILTPLNLEQQKALTAKLLDMVNRRLDDLTKSAKKSLGNPYVHSLRKKLKSLNKKTKRLDRRTKKLAEKAGASAPAPAPPAPEQK